MVRTMAFEPNDQVFACCQNQTKNGVPIHGGKNAERNSICALVRASVAMSSR